MGAAATASAAEGDSEAGRHPAARGAVKERAGASAATAEVSETGGEGAAAAAAELLGPAAGSVSAAVVEAKGAAVAATAPARIMNDAVVAQSTLCERGSARDGQMEMCCRARSRWKRTIGGGTDITLSAVKFWKTALCPDRSVNGATVALAYGLAAVNSWEHGDLVVVSMSCHPAVRSNHCASKLWPCEEISQARLEPVEIVHISRREGADAVAEPVGHLHHRSPQGRVRVGEHPELAGVEVL